MKVIAEINENLPALCCAPLVGAALSEDEAQATANLFRSLADPTRLRIVNRLASAGESVCVCDINANFDLSQPTISHHLKKLTAAGVLNREQRGTWAYYSVREDALTRLSDVFGMKKGKAK